MCTSGDGGYPIFKRNLEEIMTLFGIIFFTTFFTSSYFVLKALKEDLWSNDKPVFFTLGVICCILTMLVSFLISLVICGITTSCISEKEYNKVYRETSIVSLNIKSSVEGSFFLGCGYVEGVEYYFAFKRVRNGGYKRVKFSAGINTTIYERNDERPRVIEYRNYREPVAWIGGESFDISGWSTANHTRYRKYDIIVPVGTIVGRFELR